MCVCECIYFINETFIDNKGFPPTKRTWLLSRQMICIM